MPWPIGVLLAAKHLSVAVPGGTWNDFSDTDGIDAEVLQSVKLAFDGKTLIHPSQIAPANAAFSQSTVALSEAHAILAAFAVLDHADVGVINLGEKMVERLHLAQADRMLARQAAIEAPQAIGVSCAFATASKTESNSLRRL